MADPSHNPVIGYLIVDKEQRVIGPPGKDIDPVFCSKERALQASEEYGCRDEVFEVIELWLEGAFNVVLHDNGDLLFDGPTAQRFVEACQRRGMILRKKAVKEINALSVRPRYSCRELFGELETNRRIALSDSSQGSGSQSSR